MKKLLLAPVLLLLASCDGSSGTKADGYYFENKEFSATSLQANVVEHKSLNDLQRYYSATTNKSANDGSKSVQAFTLYTYANGHSKCEIHIVDPAVDYMPEFIGHELVHCIHGRFHKNQD